jgi:hypothetical protein
VSDFWGGVADFDQHHAQAIDYLREADTFLLAVPQLDEEAGEFRIVLTGGGPGFDSFRAAVAAGLNEEAWKEITKFLHRDRWLRRVLIAAASANVLLVVFNLSDLIR